MADKPATRKDTRTDRKNFVFRSSVTNALIFLADFEKKSETEAAASAILQAARKIPVLGEIPCGPMAEIQDQDIESWISPGDLLKTREGDFFLKARGDSMTGDGIMEGDLVLVRPQTSCDSGEVAAVLIDTAMGTRATLKKVEYSANSPIVRLVPMNDKHEIVEIDTTNTELRICGVKRGVIRMH